MTDSPSNNAIIFAIIALDNEIAEQKAYLDTPGIEENERDEAEDVLDDLEQAFMEFLDIYKQRCKQDRQLPGIDELLNNE